MRNLKLRQTWPLAERADNHRGLPSHAIVAGEYRILPEVDTRRACGNASRVTASIRNLLQRYLPKSLAAALIITPELQTRFHEAGSRIAFTDVIAPGQVRLELIGSGVMRYRCGLAPA